VFTVAASTIDREFNSFVTLGNNKILKVCWFCYSSHVSCSALI
jgi:hypothetical protein